MPTPTQNAAQGSAEIIKQFQLAPLSIKDKSDKDFGLSIARYIDSTIGGSSGYYFNRNARYRINRDWANGRMDIQAKFRDRLKMNGKETYANLGWQPIQIVNRIISGLVGRWMSRNEKIDVTAIDSLSIGEKRKEYEYLDFIISQRERLQQLQEKTGIQMIPKEGVPDDKEGLDLWVAYFQRIPEEILFEYGANDVLQSNGLSFLIQSFPAMWCLKSCYDLN